MVELSAERVYVELIEVDRQPEGASHFPRGAQKIRTLDISSKSPQTTSMDKLACMKAISAADGEFGRDGESAGHLALLAEIGGELVEGSGFENEEPEACFEEPEVS